MWRIITKIKLKGESMTAKERESAEWALYFLMSCDHLSASRCGLVGQAVAREQAKKELRDLLGITEAVEDELYDRIKLEELLK